MSELPEAKVEKAGATDALLLEYDYFKHLSTISLVTIGALLTWVQGGKGTTLVMISITTVAMSAVFSFSAMNQIILHRKIGKPMCRFFQRERTISTATYATGLGIAMSGIGKVINLPAPAAPAPARVSGSGRWLCSRSGAVRPMRKSRRALPQPSAFTRSAILMIRR